MPDEVLLRHQAREALRSGKLPNRQPDRTFSGPGRGVVCSLCGQLVKVHQVEIEIDFSRDDMRTGLDHYLLHLRCLAAWEFERTKIEGVSI